MVSFSPSNKAVFSPSNMVILKLSQDLPTVTNILNQVMQVIDEASVSVATGFYENLIDACRVFNTA